MVDLVTKQRVMNASPLQLAAFEYDPASVAIVDFAKETGGSGATGAAMSLVELLISRQIPVHIVDLASKQLDLAYPYSSVAGVAVHEQGAGVSNEATVLRAVAAAEQGSVIVCQFPASQLEKIAALNLFLEHVLAQTDAPVTATTIWTMDSDRCSSDTLQLMLDSKPPGPLNVNWPEWNGPVQLDATVERKVAAKGGIVFSMPSLPEPYYGLFKRDRIAPATQHARGDFAARSEIDFWRHRVWQALGGVA